MGEFNLNENNHHSRRNERNINSKSNYSTISRREIEKEKSIRHNDHQENKIRFLNDELELMRQENYELKKLLEREKVENNFFNL